MTYKRWTPQQIWKARQLKAMGYSYKEIGAEVSKTPGAVGEMLYRYKRGGYKLCRTKIRHSLRVLGLRERL